MIKPLIDKAIDGERLTPDEGLELLGSNDLSALGAAANAVANRLHPEDYRTYNIDRNINYTNICTAVCDFSARSIAGRKIPQDTCCRGPNCSKKSKKPCPWAATRS